MHRVARRGLAQQEVAVAEDDGQQVAEVVGQPAGEAAHGLHALALADLLLECPPFGQVGGDEQDPGCVALAIKQTRSRDPQVEG